jgi:hypothetical protein
MNTDVDKVGKDESAAAATMPFTRLIQRLLPLFFRTSLHQRAALKPEAQVNIEATFVYWLAEMSKPDMNTGPNTYWQESLLRRG